MFAQNFMTDYWSLAATVLGVGLVVGAAALLPDSTVDGAAPVTDCSDPEALVGIADRVRESAPAHSRIRSPGWTS